MNPYVTIVYKCAICGTIKGEVNHWYVLTTEEGTRAFHLYEWSDLGAPLGPSDTPLCGANCAQKALERFFV